MSEAQNKNVNPLLQQTDVSGSAIYSEVEVWEFIWDAVCFSKTPDLINETNTVIIHQKIRDRFEASKKHCR